MKLIHFFVHDQYQIGCHFLFSHTFCFLFCPGAGSHFNMRFKCESRLKSRQKPSCKWNEENRMNTQRMENNSKNMHIHTNKHTHKNSDNIGSKQSVSKANIAYRVRAPPNGFEKIRFKFRLSSRDFAFGSLALIALCVCVCVRSSFADCYGIKKNKLVILNERIRNKTQNKIGIHCEHSFSGWLAG